MDPNLLASITLPVLEARADGRIVYMNTAAAIFWNLPPGEPRGLTLAHLFGPDSLVGLHVGRAIAQETSLRIDALRLEERPNLPPALIQVQIDPVSAAREPVTSALVLVWDQTHREQLRTAEREHQVLDAIALMVRRLAHELQNPLSGIKGATQLLARQVDDNQALQEYPEVILNEIRRMERLVQTMLVHGREPPLHKAAFNLHQLLDTVIWFQSNAGHGTHIVRDYDPSLPDLYADRDRLHQVFLNLLQNAAEASPEGGTITVRTRVVGPWGGADGLAHPARANFQIEIEDQGPGVAPEHVERLFTPFFTTKPTGTGLGLSVSYQIVRSHHGQLRYRPGPGRGSVFVVTLPLEKAG